jgi:hypothetical protein
MKKSILIAALIGVALGANAQGNNTGMGGNDGDYQSIAERVLKLEKHNDIFNVYLNYAAAAHAQGTDGTWTSGFANKQLRLEIKGNLTDHLYYRLRHRMNKATDAKGEDNFAKATDIMMVGYKFSDKLNVQAGKMCQIWGGFEFDANPMYIYQYSDMVDNMDNFMAGVTVSYKPVPTQEIAVEVSDANNDKFAKEYPGAAAQGLTASNNPLTYIVNWNGSFFGDKLQTRWSWGIQTQARHKYSRMLVFGQKLNLPTFQWYFDYMGAFDGLDRLQIASNELGSFMTTGQSYFTDVHYNSFISKMDWQFAPQWNFFVKGMYETASVTKVEKLKDYRKSFGYFAGIEYYPEKSQDFRVSLSYIGRKYNYSDKCGLKDYNTNRIELGFMYRIKCF